MQTSRRSLLKGLAAAPVLLSPALLSACGSSSSKSGTLNVGQISNSVAFFPLFVAEQQGYFKDERLTLGERPRLGTGAKVAAALKSGSIDLGGGVMTDALNLAEIDDSTRITTALVQQFYVDIVAGNALASTSAPPPRRRARSRARRSGSPGPGAAPRPWSATCSTSSAWTRAPTSPW